MTKDVDMKEASSATESPEAKKEEVKHYPNFRLAQLSYNYTHTKSPETLQQILKIVKEDHALAFYQDFVAKNSNSSSSASVTNTNTQQQQQQQQSQLKLDHGLISIFEKHLKDSLDAIKKKELDAEELGGDIEIKNAILDKADLYTRIGDKELALKYYTEGQEKTVGIGGRMDNLLSCIRICLFWDDQMKVKEYIDKGYLELKKGADFERKNKLKVYEGVYWLRERDFGKAARLFLDSVATFMAVELMSMEDFVFYTVLTSMMGLSRSELFSKVIGSPEILSVIHEKAHVKEFLFAFYDCEYKTWTREFVGVIDHIREDRYFSPHLMYITKGLRLNAYKQFITAYKSVTIKMMAETFGVSKQFIDEEVYTFISTKSELPCQIDKVDGLIETIDIREGQKSVWYKEVIKEGDDLLNKMQKLAAAIAV